MCAITFLRRTINGNFLTDQSNKLQRSMSTIPSSTAKEPKLIVINVYSLSMSLPIARIFCFGAFRAFHFTEQTLLASS